jgi:hypothetical protein
MLMCYTDGGRALPFNPMGHPGAVQVETYADLKELVENPFYREQRQRTLAGLRDDMIDAPIVDIVKGLNELPCCFTLQCCCGHFVHSNQLDPHNLDPLPVADIMNRVEYRIAYVSLCVENSVSGRELIEILRGVTALDPENVQFFCAEWFWERQVNSYALQVMPGRFKHLDSTVLAHEEALRVERLRNEFFQQLRKSLNSI